MSTINIPKLKPAIKERWLEALRSGRYKQGRRRLAGPTAHGDYTYCCLGVLCDVLKDELKLKVTSVANILHFDGEGYGLPESVREYVTDDCDAEFCDLATRNDGGYESKATDWGRPQSFKQIANLIERHG